MPRQLFDQALDLLLKKDMAGFAGLWAEDGRMEFPFAPASWPSEVNGREAIHDYLRDYPKLLDVQEIPWRQVHETADPLPWDPNAELVRRLPEWAVLRPSWFMQNFTGNHAVAQGVAAGEIVTATGDGRVAFVDADDIAAVAVKALTGTPHNAEHVITGPEALSYAEAAAMIETRTGTTVKHRSITAAELAQHLAAHVPEPFAVMLAALDEAISAGAEDRVTTTVEDVTGRKPRSFREFVAAQW